MKAGIVFTGTGPILILTSYDSFKDERFIEKLETKGIKKFISHELPVELVKTRYGKKFGIIMGDLEQTDDLRVLDYNGHNVFYNFSFDEMGPAVFHETPKDAAA